MLQNRLWLKKNDNRRNHGNLRMNNRNDKYMGKMNVIFILLIF